MRKMYVLTLTSPCQVYLHAYEEGNPEVELNLLFRDYLASNKDARDAYSALKRSIVQNCPSRSKSKLPGTGITTYNCMKSDFIQDILARAEFNGLCMRLCAQDVEWLVYNSIRPSGNALPDPIYGPTHDINPHDPSQKHLVLYEGVRIVAGAQLQLSVPNAFLLFLGLSPALSDAAPERRVFIMSYFLKNIEKWAAGLGAFFLTTIVPREESEFFETLGTHVYKKAAQTE